MDIDDLLVAAERSADRNNVEAIVHLIKRIEVGVSRHEIATDMQVSCLHAYSRRKLRKALKVLEREEDDDRWGLLGWRRMTSGDAVQDVMHYKKVLKQTTPCGECTSCVHGGFAPSVATIKKKRRVSVFLDTAVAERKAAIAAAFNELRKETNT